MPVGSGLSAQIGFAQETAVGTIATPTRFLEFNSESLSLEKNIVQGSGLRAGGQYARSNRRAYTTKTAGGDVELDVVTRGMGLLFKNMLGAAAPPVLIGGVGSAYQHVYTPGNTTGLSMTVQKGVPQLDGVVRPFTYNGCKVAEWELSCEVGEILTLSVGLDAWNETTGTALATASYTAGAQPFHFAQGAILLGGTASTSGGVTTLTGGTAVAAVTGASISGTNNLANERFYFGSAGVKAEQIENDWRELSGSLDVEFVSQAAVYDTFASDAATALQLTFTNPTAISGSNFPTVEVLIPSIRFDGESPQVGGPDIVTQSCDFTGLEDAAGNPAIQIRYITADSTV